MSRIFINYRRQDSEGYVGRLYDHLSQYFDAQDIFIDVVNIEPGVDFVAKLDEAVANCDVFVAVIGTSWLNVPNEDGQPRLAQWNDFVRLEIAAALKHEKFIIPVLVGQAIMPNMHHLPEDIQGLARRNAITLRHAAFPEDVKRLADAIRSATIDAKRKTNALTPLKPAVDANILIEREAAIKKLRMELVGAMESPLYQYRTENRYYPVLGAGNVNANILFIGEAPSKYDAEVGQPFQGPSGDVLNEMFTLIGLKRDDVYMTNVVMDRLPDNRDPQPAEIAFYRPFVDSLLDIIQPVVYVTLGRFAMSHILHKFNSPEKKAKISQQRGKLMKASVSYGDVYIVPLYHPAVVLYRASDKEIFRKDFEKLRLFM